MKGYSPMSDKQTSRYRIGHRPKLALIVVLLSMFHTIEWVNGQVNHVWDDPMDLMAVESTLDESRFMSRHGEAVPRANKPNEESRAGRRLRLQPGLMLLKRPNMRLRRPLRQGGPIGSVPGPHRKHKVHHDNIMAENSQGPVTHVVPPPQDLPHRQSEAVVDPFKKIPKQERIPKPEKTPNPIMKYNPPRRSNPPPFQGNLDTSPTVAKVETFKEIKKLPSTQIKVAPQTQAPADRRMFDLSGGLNLLNKMAHRLTTGMGPRPSGKRPRPKGKAPPRGNYRQPRPKSKKKKKRPSYDVPMAPVLKASDVYGAPKAPPIQDNSNGYGSPQAPVKAQSTDSYGAPQAAALGNSDSYGVPQGPVSNPESYGAPQASPLRDDYGSDPASVPSYGGISGYDPLTVFGSKGFVPTGTRNNFDESIQDEIGSYSETNPSHAFMEDIETAKREISHAVTPKEELIKPSDTQIQYQQPLLDPEASSSGSGNYRHSSLSIASPSRALAILST